MQAGAKPNWIKTGCGPDVAQNHIYKLLFALAADPEFLVEDRLHAWVLDLATSSLAMHALAWTDRYNTMAHQNTDEQLFWGAFHEIFFGSEPLETGGWNLLAAIACWDADWGTETFELFCAARDIYRSRLSDGGISFEEVISASMQARIGHPIVYR